MTVYPCSEHVVGPRNESFSSSELCIERRTLSSHSSAVPILVYDSILSKSVIIIFKVELRFCCDVTMSLCLIACVSLGLIDFFHTQVWRVCYFYAHVHVLPIFVYAIAIRMVLQVNSYHLYFEKNYHLRSMSK